MAVQTVWLPEDQAAVEAKDRYDKFIESLAKKYGLTCDEVMRQAFNQPRDVQAH